MGQREDELCKGEEMDALGAKEHRPPPFRKTAFTSTAETLASLEITLLYAQEEE